MQAQIRIYTINKGELDNFIKHFKEETKPIHDKVGWPVVASWVNRPQNEFNGRHGTREDIVFLINGIPVLVIECKNATKDEAIALGVDQVRRYHAETPELFVP